ncbi:type VII secretion-associated serine protease mycosin [Corynebacterium ulceribovis]|uniref:type VII secretion-associated serine protease mycosin n=1 Tax=Corynebacterium ulceribovis TaxID=487732 RepID=UPI00035DEE53|nr:type VII secretion-associated serine protease mycosin [Corynebacterium ulceribovis]
MRRELRALGATAALVALALPGAVSPSPAAPVAAAQEAPPEIRQHIVCQPGRLSSSEAPKRLPAAHIPRSDSVWHVANGRGVTVAVIDTGVAPHQRLGSVIDGGDFVAGDTALADCDSHGTTVAGIIAARPHASDQVAGIAPRAQIVAVRQSSAHFRVRSSTDKDPDAATSSGVGNLSTLAAAIDRAREQRADVINMSVVACAPPTVTPTGAADVRAAVERAHTAGIVLVAAAGNTSPTCKYGAVAWPAHLPQVIAVAALEQRHSPAEYSVPGPWVDIAAPGGPVVGLAPSDSGLIDGGETADGPYPLIGTSFAAPVVAGSAALLRQLHPTWSPAEIKQRLLATASPASPSAGLGVGVVDPVAAVMAPLTGTGGAYGTTHAAANPVPAPASPPTPDPTGPKRFGVVAGLAALLLVVATAAAALPVLRRELD